MLCDFYVSHEKINSIVLYIKKYYSDGFCRIISCIAFNVIYCEQFCNAKFLLKNIKKFEEDKEIVGKPVDRICDRIIDHIKSLDNKSYFIITFKSLLRRIEFAYIANIKENILITILNLICNKNHRVMLDFFRAVIELCESVIDLSSKDSLSDNIKHVEKILGKLDRNAQGKVENLLYDRIKTLQLKQKKNLQCI